MKKEELRVITPIKSIEEVIYFIRGQKVMLDRDLAILYGIETKKLVQAVKRNTERFPEDFMFQLSWDEAERSRSQIVTLNRGQNIKYLPYAFTEQGVAMLSSVLRSPQAVKVNIEIMRAFIKLRHTLSSHKELAKKLKEIQDFMLKNSLKTDREFKRVWNAIEKLSAPPPKQEREEPRIGFRLDY